VPSGKDPAANEYDRYELLMLKGESHLQLRQAKPAADAFAAAAKETDDQNHAAIARATQRLVRDAKGMKIQRKSAGKGDRGPQSVDLLDRDKRGEAFSIVYDDARTAAEPTVKVALRARTLPPIAEALELLDGLADLEVATTGGVAANEATRQDLGERASSLIEKELERMEKDVADIRTSAEEIVKEVYSDSLINGGAGNASSATAFRRGLSKQDRLDLTEAIQMCKKIIPTAESLAGATSRNLANVDELVNRAKEIMRAAERTLKTRY
jgi:hypothetical protein